MTLQECTALLTPLALAMRADFDEVNFRAYHGVLKAVPAGLGQAAIDDLTHAGLRFMPTAPDILAASERARRRLLALHRYDGCVDCEDQIGWQTVLTEGGQKAVQPCPCKARHVARLDDMGLRAEIALLPGEAGVGESEQVFPTVEQIPAALRKQLLEAVRQKVLR